MKKIIIGAILFAASSVSSASIIDLGTITRDTDTGLDWLDLTSTNNISYNDMEVLLGSEPLYDGFRRATAQEAEELFSNAGIVSFGIFSTDNIAGAQLLTSLLGDTLNGAESGRNGGRGFLADMSSNPNLPIRTAAYLTDVLVFGNLRGYALSPDGEISLDLATTRYGHYLVRASAVPIPAAAWLFLSAVGGLIGAKWKSRS